MRTYSHGNDDYISAADAADAAADDDNDEMMIENLKNVCPFHEIAWQVSRNLGIPYNI